MKDFLGNILSVGDRVVVTSADYKVLTSGKVIGFTTKRVKVATGNYKTNTWNKDFGYQLSVELLKIK